MDIRELIEKYGNGQLESMILSNARTGEVQKEKIRPVLIKNDLAFQAEQYRGAKVFHSNLSPKDLAGHVEEAMQTLFKQCELKHRDGTAVILSGKSGRVTVKDRPAEKRDLQYTDHTAVQWDVSYLQHNRAKKRLIPEGTDVPFLRELGVFGKDNRAVKAKYDKFRQINRFLEFVDDVCGVLPKDRPVNILDFGCGKSYLTFAVYHYLTEEKKLAVDITGLDLKADVVRDCETLARRCGYDGLHFVCGDVKDFEGKQTDMMMTLHACDTATDHALAYAVKTGARVILSVPCCQHELNGQFDDKDFYPLFRYGIIKERMSALVTDALRARTLEACGYSTGILEFIDIENTPKNLLIRGVKNPNAKEETKRKARESVLSFAGQYGLKPTLLELLDI